MQQTNLAEINLKLPQKIVDSLVKNEIISLLEDKALYKTEYYLTRCLVEKLYGILRQLKVQSPIPPFF